MLKRGTVLLLVLVASAFLTPSLSAREWIAKSGHKVQGDFVKLENGIVYIAPPGGKTVKIKFDLLSESDQGYVKSQTEKKSSPEPRDSQPPDAEILKKFTINSGATFVSVTDIKGEINITDADIAVLAEAYPNLTGVNFIKCEKITGSGLEGLTKLRHLQLQLCYNLTDDGLKSLKDLTQLESVMLTSCSGITDVGVENLKGLKKLKHLQLVGTSITDDSLEHFRKMNLKQLNLNLCEKITPKAVEDLRKAMPNCGILHNVGKQPTN